MSKPKVSIIILNWNQPEFTVSCVKSVLKPTYKDFEILLVDNGSEDNSVEIFKKEFSRNKNIRILETGKNLGYAGGNNEGVKFAKGEYIVILNNDTIVREDWLGILVEGLESDEKISAVSSIEIREGKKVLRDYSTSGLTTSLLTYHAQYKYKNILEKTDLIEVFGIKGTSFIYKKNLVDLPFDPEYFIYGEDTYLGWLFRLRGYKNLLSTKYSFEHFHNITKKTTNKKMNRFFIYLGERNRVMNLFLFYEINTLIKILPLMFFGIILINFFQPKKFISRFNAYIWILTHIKKIIKKRRNIQKQRKISDPEIIKKMSCKFYEETKMEEPISRSLLILINKIFCLYCRLVGLKTVEFR